MEKSFIAKNKISILRIVSQMLYLAVFLGALVSKHFLFLFITLSAIILGPIFCGWMCFVGFYQDLLRYIGSIFKKQPVEVAESLHKYLKYSRYVFLLGSLIIGGIFLLPGRLRHGFSVVLKGNHVGNYIIIFWILFGFLSFFSTRFFCRYICTFGAKLGFFSLLRPVTINRDDTCISCGICSQKCPMHIKVEKINSLANPNCINCLKCVEGCPVNSLKIGFRNYLKP